MITQTVASGCVVADVLVGWCLRSTLWCGTYWSVVLHAWGRGTCEGALTIGLRLHAAPRVGNFSSN
jgi:hypothetical protein